MQKALRREAPACWRMGMECNDGRSNRKCGGEDPKRSDHTGPYRSFYSFKFYSDQNQKPREGFKLSRDIVCSTH